jgi:hypothetical protein
MSAKGRQRLRAVSPERIAKVMRAIGDVQGVELQTDGSAVILTAGGNRLPLRPKESGPNEWDDADLGRI